MKRYSRLRKAVGYWTEGFSLTVLRFLMAIIVLLCLRSIVQFCLLP